MVFPIAGGTQDTGFEISNSLRFNNDDTAYLNFTPSGAGNKKTWTWSGWIKLGHFDSSNNRTLFASTQNDTNSFEIKFDNNDKIQVRGQVGGSKTLELNTNQLFRDTSAWYHIVYALDTTNGTASNRQHLYINGSEVTSFSTETNPGQNDEYEINEAQEHQIGAQDGGNLFDGYISEVYFIDGTQYAASDFGETNDNGVWVPKKFAGTFGSNGFKLEFKQTGTSANSSGIGADTSGNDNHFAVSNLAATDVTTDTPTNNFATLNPLDRHANVVLSEGNLQTVNTSGGGHYPIFTNMAFKNGKWYAEFKRADGNNWKAAIMSIEHDGGSLSVDSTVGNSVSPVNRAGYGLNVDDGNKTHYDGSSFLNQSYGSEIGSILMWAFDADNGKIWWGEDGTFFASGDPAAGTNAAFTGIDTNTLWTLAFHTYNGHNLIANFGNPPFSISSGNADANGYGNFEYAPPSGFYSLCTKNLAEYG